MSLMVVASSSSFYYSDLLFWDIDILDTHYGIDKVFLLLHCSNQIRKMRKKEKVSGPKKNHNYISYSDIKIRYRWNRGSGPLISLDHVRIRRPIESSCSWMLYRNFSLFLSSTEKGSFRVTRAISLFFFHFYSFCYGNAMQEVGKKVVFNDEKSFFLCYVKLMKTRYLKVGNVRRRLSVSDGKIPTVGISLKAQTERINGLLEGYLSHFSANQKDWSCWMLLSAAIT